MIIALCGLEGILKISKQSDDYKYKQRLTLEKYMV